MIDAMLLDFFDSTQGVKIRHVDWVENCYFVPQSIEGDGHIAGMTFHGEACYEESLDIGNPSEWIRHEAEENEDSFEFAGEFSDWCTEEEGQEKHECKCDIVTLCECGCKCGGK